MEKAKDAIRIILSDTKSYNTSLNWAVHRLRAALAETDEEKMRTRVLYILNNITHWRHPQAKACRKVLKDYVERTR